MHTITSYFSLDDSVERLRNDLDPLKSAHSHLKRVGLFVTHDNEDVIEVYGDINYKAYVPRRYDGWEVQFYEWNGTDDIMIDMDEDLLQWMMTRIRSAQHHEAN